MHRNPLSSPHGWSYGWSYFARAADLTLGEAYLRVTTSLKEAAYCIPRWIFRGSTYYLILHDMDVEASLLNEKSNSRSWALQWFFGLFVHYPYSGASNRTLKSLGYTRSPVSWLKLSLVEMAVWTSLQKEYPSSLLMATHQSVGLTVWGFSNAVRLVCRRFNLAGPAESLVSAC